MTYSVVREFNSESKIETMMMAYDFGLCLLPNRFRSSGGALQYSVCTVDSFRLLSAV